MSASEIVGIVFLCLFLTSFFVFFFWSIYNDYDVFTYDGQCFVIRNVFKTYRIFSVEKTGVWVSAKNGQRFINASKITNFGLLRFRVFERQFDTVRESGCK